MRTLNLGILAHVDAGKTTLTERLLYAAGVIDEIGSVDDGSTQTDTLPLERERGITIKSAVVSFVIDGVTINLIDTPGHPDFIAEVERVLSVLDGAVLVISAVEGVQAQTLVLMRTLQRLHIPTVLFVNKIDRGGARFDGTLRAIAEKLTPAIVAMGSVRDMGAHDAHFTPYTGKDAAFISALANALVDRDEALLAACVDGDSSVSYGRLRDALAEQASRAFVHPVFFGSAITGAGVDALMAGVTEFLPSSPSDSEGPVAGTVFKIERGVAGEKIAYVRMFSGTICVRDRLTFGQATDGKVTAISVFERGAAIQRSAVGAGQIAKLWGLRDVRVGDTVGESDAEERHYFAPPTLETAIVPCNPSDKGALHVALTELAEQDPLINLRQDERGHEIFVSLYGEVQKQVIEATLAAEYNLDVEFRETTTIFIERPLGSGEAGEVLRAKTPTNVTGKSSPQSPNAFPATLGLHIEPAQIGSGIGLQLDVDVRLVPLYIYKTVNGFMDQLTGYVREALREGLFGWQVTDCTVTVIDCGYRAPGTTAADFRRLTPLVLMAALRQAGTIVCEPIHRFRLELPADTLGATLPALSRLRAVPLRQEAHGRYCLLEGDIPAARVHELHQQLRGLTRGEGAVDHTFDRYQPVSGETPSRARTDHNPLDRKEYLLHVLRRV